MKEKIEYNGFELVNIFFEIYEDAVRVYGHRWENKERIELGSTNSHNITEGKKPLKVFESVEQYNKYNWCQSWKRLDEKDQLLIWAMFGKEWILKEYKENFKTLKTPEKLRSSALKNFYRMGWNKPCTRCGGSGRYSYCTAYGSTCFKCSGNKLQLTVPTKAELNRFLKKYPEGLTNLPNDIFYEIKGKGEYKLKRKDEQA
jgi:hypothetical protein